MSQDDKSRVRIAVDALRVGHYVDLERSWTDHPFLFSKFRISTPAEIEAIRGMGLAEVTVLPGRSKVAVDTPAPAPAAVAAESVRQELWDRKQELINRASRFRGERQQAARAYQETVRKINNFARDLRTAPANAVLVAEEIVEEMAKAFEQDSSVLLNLVNLSDESFSVYSHSLNVTVLSLSLARFLKLRPDEMRALGMGALVHDIGKIEIPTQITSKRQPLNASEEALMRTHPALGSRLAQKVRTITPPVVAIIEQHHECMDGSGYPRQIEGRWLSQLVRIVSLCNVYDNLCNPPDPARALSPRDAMAQLFKSWENKLDRDLVGAFIKCMGVYPPGTVVQLSDDDIGMVVSVESDNLLRPRVILYNPDIPRQDALMIDLRERPDLDIRQVLKPTQFPARIFEYLGLSERLGYFYENRHG